MNDIFTDLEAESNLLAIMLNDENSLATAIYEFNESDFYNPANQMFFGILSSLFAKNIIPTVLEVAKEAKQLAVPFDEDYLFTLNEYYITSTQYEYWKAIVKDKAKRRAMKHLLNQLHDSLKSEKDTDKIANDFSAGAMQLQLTDQIIIQTGRDLAKVGREAFKKAKENKGTLTGINTGIGKLNRLTGGWNLEDLIILAAETGKGKTAFSINFAINSAIYQSISTLYVNSEMSDTQIVYRMASILTGITGDTIKEGKTTTQQETSLDSSMQLVEDAPLYHYYSANLDLKGTVAAIRKMKIKNGIKLCIVDYVGRMEKLTKDITEWQMLEQIVKTFKNLARELKIAIIVVAQLNDDQKLQGAKRMENEANVFLKLLPIPEDQAEELRYKYSLPPNYFVYLKKNRDGMSDVYIPTYFEKETLRVIDVKNL